jgi:hypothetical protein
MPEIVTTIVMGLSYFLAGGVGYLVKMCHRNIEKEVVVIEEKVENLLEKIGVPEEMVKEFDTIVEDIVEKIEICAGIDKDDIKFDKTS